MRVIDSTFIHDAGRLLSLDSARELHAWLGAEIERAEGYTPNQTALWSDSAVRAFAASLDFGRHFNRRRAGK